MSLAIMSAMAIICADLSSPAQTVPVAIQSATAAESTAEPLAEEPVIEEPAIIDGETAIEAETIAAEETFDDPLVFEDESDEAVAARLINYIENLDTLNGSFTQIAPSGAISDGKFYLRRPGFLRFEYDPPTPLLIVANGGMVYVRDEALETTDSYPVGRTPLKFLLSKKIDRDDAKVVQVDRGIDNVAVTFSSSDEETEGELTLIATAPDFELRRWIIHDAQGGITVVTLNDVKSGERLANSLFRAPEAGGRFLDR
ncbi:outer-membrane lipoprotein carrier protein LolA [Hyphococcus sp. DH-69]|uniref:LolA family protein n=1 Tax=Hyphococcus formosus TaxID=3143534 RepID=UPI00398BAC6B